MGLELVGMRGTVTFVLEFGTCNNCGEGKRSEVRV
jgi:hypothetical protein